MIYEFDGFRLDIGAFELSRDGRSVPLERQVYDVLAYLVQNHERLVPKEELLEKVWGDRFVSDAALNSRVMAARKAIGDSGKEQRLIRTVHGRGYRFVGDVGSAAAEAGSQARSVPSVALTGGRLPEPSIRYATARDGVSIAYWVMGEGPPLLYMPSAVFNPVDRALRTPEGRRWVEELASRRTVIRYDHRGFGQSQQDVETFSLDAFVSDMEAVVDDLGLERFALFGNFGTGPVAIAYTARHPERVSELILWCAYARGADLPRYRSLQSAEWDVYVETLALGVFGWSAQDQARLYASVLRQIPNPERVRRSMDVILDSDTTDLLPMIACPTLVLHRSQLHLTGLAVAPVDAARYLAARIPGAIMRIVEGESGAAFVGDMDEVLAVMDEFLGVARPAPVESELPSGTAVILFADIADSTALTERLGDDAFRAKARELDGALRAVIREHRGTPVEGKLLGDGVLAVFTSARRAIEAALGCGRSGDEAGLPLHLGLHAGDVIREESNVYGGAVNIAARVSALAAPGEVLVSDIVRGLARTSAGVSFEERGERELKGVSDPVRMYKVRRRE